MRSACPACRSGIRRVFVSMLLRVVTSGIRGRILALVFCAAAIVAVCVGGFLVQVRANLREQVLRDQEALAKSYAVIASEYFSSASSALELAAQSPAIRAPLDM